MLPVVHRPMIVRLVERLAEGGVTDVVLALGFKPEPFREAFPDGRHGDVRVHYAVEPEPLDTAGAIAFAAREAGIDETFVVANGDIVTDLDVKRLVDAHRSARSEAMIHLTPVADPSAFGVVETDPTGVGAPLRGEAGARRDRFQPDQRRHIRARTVRARLDRAGPQGVDRARDVPAPRRPGHAGGAGHRRLLDRRRPAVDVPARQPRPCHRPGDGPAGKRRRARDRADSDGRRFGALRRQRRRCRRNGGCEARR